MKIDLSDRSKVESAICGAVKDTINQHGDITLRFAPSAAKRIYGMLKMIARQQEEEKRK